MSKLPLVWCELVCGQCAVTTSGEWIRERAPVLQMVEDAKREGWRHIEFDGEVVCGEDCESKYLENHGKAKP